MGVLAVPVLFLINPDLVPGPSLCTMALLTLAMTHRDRHAVLFHDLKWALGGRLVGVGAALAFLSFLPAQVLGPLFGVLVLAAVALSASGLHLRPSPRTLLGAGALSGFMGTTVSIGGPPIALLYQHEDGSTVRGTLSAYFTIGVTISLVGLSLIGRFGWAQIRLVGFLLPGTVVGFLLAPRLHGLLDRGYMRGAILALSAVMGLGVIAKYLLGGA